MRSLQPTFEKSYRHVNVWLAIVCLTILVLMVMLVINNSVDRLKEQLRENAQLVFQNTQEALHAGENVLDGYQAYFKTVDVVDYRKLEEYSRAIRKQHPFIYMTQYMIRVENTELADFLTERRREGYATFRVTEYASNEFRTLVPVAERSVYYPLVFMDPMEIQSLSLLGFDVLSFPVMRDAVEESIRTGNARATKPFRLHTGGTGYVIISPV